MTSYVKRGSDAAFDPTPEQTAANFPDVTIDDIRACLAFARTESASRQGPGVKLLVDENPSCHVVDLLADCHPGSCHVCGVERADDSTVWDCAASLD